MKFRWETLIPLTMPQYHMRQVGKRKKWDPVPGGESHTQKCGQVTQSIWKPSHGASFMENTCTEPKARFPLVRKAGYFPGSPELPGQALLWRSMSGGNYLQICSEPPGEIRFFLLRKSFVKVVPCFLKLSHRSRSWGAAGTKRTLLLVSRNSGLFIVRGSTNATELDHSGKFSDAEY